MVARVARTKRSVDEENPCTKDSINHTYSQFIELDLACYTIARLDAHNVTESGFSFQVGDGNRYGGYENPPITEREAYQLQVAVQAKVKVR